jgi:hypothetical protein
VLLTVNTQGFVLPPHGPAVQFVKEYPVAGVAVKLTDVPDVKFVEHALGGAGFAQSISVATVGVEVLVTVPLPVNATVKLLVCAVNTAVTVSAAPIVTTHFAGCPAGTTQGPLQLVKFDVAFGSAVSVVIDPLNMLCVQTPVAVAFKVQSIVVPVPPMFPSTSPPPVAVAPGITFNAKLPVPLLNVAAISSCSSIVNVHVVVVPEHLASPIGTPHDANTDPGFAVCVNTTAVPLGYDVLHVPVAPCPLLFVQLILPRLSVTVPYAVPSSTTLNAKAVVVTVKLAAFDAIALNVAVIVATPAPNPVANPEVTVLILAMPVFDDTHTTVFVMSWMEPSL